MHAEDHVRSRYKSHDLAEKRRSSNLSAHANSNPSSPLRSLNHAELKFRKRIARILTVASHTNRRRTQDTLIRNRHFRRGIILVKNCRLYIQYPGILARTGCNMRNKFYLSSLTLTTKGRQSLLFKRPVPQRKLQKTRKMCHHQIQSILLLFELMQNAVRLPQ